MDDGIKTLDEAVAALLESGGMGLLGDSKRFVAWVADLIDPESREARVLYTSCDEQFLSYFVEALNQQTPDALQSAVARSADYLHGECLIDKAAAQQVSEQIGGGLARVLGIAYQPRATVQASAPVGSAPYAQGHHVAAGAQGTRGAAVEATDTPAVFSSQQEYEQRKIQAGADVKRQAYASQASRQPSQGAHSRQVPSAPASRPQTASVGTASAPQKKSHAGVGVFIAISLFLVLLVIGASQPNNDEVMDRLTDEGYFVDNSDTGTYDDTSYDYDIPTEGSVDGVSWHTETRMRGFYNENGDLEGWDETVLFLHNNSDETKRVTFTFDEGWYDSIPALAPGDDGLLVIDDLDNPQECLTVETSYDMSPSEALAWWEDSRDGTDIGLWIESVVGYDWPLLYGGYFTFVSDDFIVQDVSWYWNESGETIDYIPEYGITLNYDNYPVDLVFDGGEGTYDVYTQGVCIPRW